MQALTSENILESLKTEEVRQNRTCKICFIFAEHIYVKSGFYFWLTVYRWLHLQFQNAMIFCNILKSKFRIFIVWVLKKLGNWNKKGKAPISRTDGSMFLFATLSNSELKRLIILIIIQTKMWNSVSNKHCSCSFFQWVIVYRMSCYRKRENCTFKVEHSSAGIYLSGYIYKHKN